MIDEDAPKRPPFPSVWPLITVTILVVGLKLAWSLYAGAKLEKELISWNFEANVVGTLPSGFTTQSGEWSVAEADGNHVLAQKALSDDDTFNVLLYDQLQVDDIDLSVRLKAVSGELDRGGGLVWRAKDKNNYYIARYNPLENNFRVYKVQDGKRSQFQSADTPGDTNWHLLRVTMVGSRITCYLDGVKHLEVDDSTFTLPGTIGLWSKADAHTYFDDLKAARY